MRREISNRDDVIDSRDVIERIKELYAIVIDPSADMQDRLAANPELNALQALQLEAEPYAPDWTYGTTLIRDSYFVEYVEELLKDCGDLPQNIPGYIVIDWEATADNIRQDYTSVDFDGVTFWVR